MTRAVLMAGGNTGPVAENLRAVLAEIERRIGSVVSASSVYESEPWGEVSSREYGQESAAGGKAGNFLNQAVVVETALAPVELLGRIKEIESAFGRERPGENDSGNPERVYFSRKMDIDIIFYGDQIVETEFLRLPHPLMHRRRFVLEPLSEIIPDTAHPVTGKSVVEMLAELDEES